MFEFSICFIVLVSHVSDSTAILIFPRGNPTRHQFIAGIGVPVDLEPESLVSGYVFKAQYFLPYNESHLYPTRLTRDVGNYGQDFGQEGGDDEVRWAIYRTLELALNSKNIDGRQCVLRAICESSQLPFDYESGLLGEILHVLFTPSMTLAHSNRNDYIYAEELGQSVENCENVFRRCTYSLMNVFSEIL